MFMPLHIFKSAGVHRYNDEGDIIYSGNGVLTIHTKGGGSRTITLKNGKSVKLMLQASSTVILDSLTGEILMQ